MANNIPKLTEEDEGGKEDEILLDTCPNCGHEPPVMSIVATKECELCAYSLITHN